MKLFSSQHYRTYARTTSNAVRRQPSSLDKYYDFLIKNHDKFVFEGEELFETDDMTLNQYNILSEQVLNSANNIDKVYELKNNLLKDRLPELKEWLREN